MNLAIASQFRVVAKRRGRLIVVGGLASLALATIGGLVWISVAETFTGGSHREDVRRIQGTPDAIDRRSHGDEERMVYADPFVQISTAEALVTGWSNKSANLKVRLELGPNVTRSEAFDGEGTPESLTRTVPMLQPPLSRASRRVLACTN